MYYVILEIDEEGSKPVIDIPEPAILNEKQV